MLEVKENHPVVTCVKIGYITFAQKLMKINMSISKIIPCHGSVTPVPEFLFSSIRNKGFDKLVFSDNIASNTNNNHPKPTSPKVKKSPRISEKIS